MQKIFFSFILALTLVSITSCSPRLRPGGTNQGATGKANNAPGNPGGGGSGGKYTLGNFTGTVNKNITFAHNVNKDGLDQLLNLDVYEPPGAQGKKYPLILLIHGGGFRQGKRTNLSSTCAALSQNGYVCVAIDYRLGWGSGQKRAGCSDTIELKKAVYRSIQDAHAALRFLASHADEYSIDKDWIFIGGSSAGAITALATAYLSPDTADQFLPFSQQLKAINEGGNDIKTDYKLRGVISMWGAFLNPQLITSSTALPTIFFQGEKDPAVPFNVGRFMPCPNASETYGTYPLYNRLKELDVTTIAHVDPNGGHGVFSLDFRVANILCFLSNVRAGNKKQVYLTGEQSSCN